MDDSVQIPLDLSISAPEGLDDLIVTEANKDAVSFIRSWPDWPGPIAVLAGPVGGGKSHLAAIWAQQSKALVLDSLTGLECLPEAGTNVVLEDLEAGNFDQTALFHLINSARAHSTSLLLTSRFWPGNWDIQLPDLQSRIRLAHLLELSEPDDELLRGVLSKMFFDRQIEVEPNVIDYLVLRMERSLAYARQVVAELDALSMSQKRPITRPLAAIALRQLGLQEQLDLPIMQQPLSRKD
ncbi:MAG: HdaA/DnaA family protein [Rhizobiaceae bacterium]